MVLRSALFCLLAGFVAACGSKSALSERADLRAREAGVDAADAPDADAADVPDAADAPDERIDALEIGVDLGPVCDECSDGLFCNGDEICTDDGCLSPGRICDDGDECTV
ncbi:MAG: hypothetical protein AAF938_19445, partial [Myxococcota bacterium]